MSISSSEKTILAAVSTLKYFASLRLVSSSVHGADNIYLAELLCGETRSSFFF